jgi:plasmid maintenance system antidote protein VapI
MRKQIKQQQIARRAQIRPDFLSHILHGRRPCPKGVALRLEAVTGIDRSVWIWGSPEEMRQAIAKFMYQRGSHGS